MQEQSFHILQMIQLYRKYIPVLGEAVDQVGGPQVRNIGTIGGNICNGAVSADSVPTVFSLQFTSAYAGMKMEGRIVPVREFYLGPGKVNLQGRDTDLCDRSCKRI